MGKDKKRDRDSDSEEDKKKKKRDRADSSDSDSDRDKKSKKHKKDKKEKKDKKDKKSHKDKKSSGFKPSEEISSDDYFKKNPEFRLWLTESKGKVFGDLSDKETKKYFSKFVEKWNDGELSEKLYKGVAFAELSGVTRTTHKWGFAKEKDSMATDSMKDKIFSDTQNATLLGGKPAPPAAARAGPASAVVAAAAGGAFEKEEEWERMRAQSKLSKKEEVKRQKERLEEMAPRPDPGSFQARMEKRAQKGHYCRERPPSPEMKDSDLMGGGDSIKAHVMRQRDSRERREAQKQVQGQAKLAAYQAAEKEKMNEFRRMMGLPTED